MNDSASLTYVGQELELFARAINWKAYWSSQVSPWIRGDVLEVGAGLGANTARMHNRHVRSWHCLEPDPKLLTTLLDNVRSLQGCTASIGTIDTMTGRSFDTIIYIDVLEHIEDDDGELEKAAALLRPGGHLVVLAPAHQRLFTPFDAAIGHYRRYNAATLAACGPASCRLRTLFYLDSVGIMTSLANRLLLNQKQPTPRQIAFWDTCLIPISRVLDPLTRHRFGKSIVAVWTREPSVTDVRAS